VGSGFGGKEAIGGNGTRQGGKPVRTGSLGARVEKTVSACPRRGDTVERMWGNRKSLWEEQPIQLN